MDQTTLESAAKFALPGGVTVNALDTPFRAADFSAAEFGCTETDLAGILAGLNVAHSRRLATPADDGKSRLPTIEKVTTLSDGLRKPTVDRDTRDRSREID